MKFVFNIKVSLFAMRNVVMILLVLTFGFHDVKTWAKNYESLNVKKVEVSLSFNYHPWFILKMKLYNLTVSNIQ